MNVRYEMLSDDAVALALHHLETSASHRRMRIGLQWGLPILLFALLALTLRSKFGLVAGAFLAVSYSLRIPMVLRRSCERQVRKQLSQDGARRALGAHSLSVEEGQVWVEGPAGRAHFSRSDVSQLIDTPQHVFIHLPAGAVITVPKRTLSVAEVNTLLRALGND